MTIRRKGQMFGAVASILLLVITARANYVAYLYQDLRYINVTIVAYIAIAFAAALGLNFVKREGLYGTCTGFLAVAPLLFFFLGYGAHLGILARNA